MVKDLDQNIDLEELTSQISEINWKESFELKDLQVLMPPTPGVKINTVSTALSKPKFLLEEQEQNNSIETVSKSPPKAPENRSRVARPISQSELSTCSSISFLKQSTPEISRMHMQSPEQSRIIANAGDKLKLETTPVSGQSGFSSIHEPREISSRNLTAPPRRFILSPGLFSGDTTPDKAAMTPPPNLNNLVTKFDLSSPSIGYVTGAGNTTPEIPISSKFDLTGKKINFANTPAGKRLHKRLSDLMTTLRSSEDEKPNDSSSFLLKNDSISSKATDSLLLTAQPDFSGIDF